MFLNIRWDLGSDSDVRVVRDSVGEGQDPLFKNPRRALETSETHSEPQAVHLSIFANADIQLAFTYISSKSLCTCICHNVRIRSCYVPEKI